MPSCFRAPTPAARLRCFCALALIALALPARAEATTMRLASADELARLADTIVVAEVGRSATEWRGDRIFTTYSVKVVRALKGDIAPDTTLQIATLGGIVDSVGQRVSGAARLLSGARMLLYLAADGTYYRAVGMWQGAFLLSPVDSADPSQGVRAERATVDARVIGAVPQLPSTLAALEFTVKLATDGLNAGSERD